MSPKDWSLSDIALDTIICSYVFSALAIICMIVHIFVSIRYRRLSIEDYMTFFAFISAMILVGQTTWAVINEGQGQHMADISHGQFELTAKSLLANEVSWASVNTFVRLSALSTFYQLFGRCIGSIRRGTISLLVLSLLYGAAALLTAVLICRPIQAAWDNAIEGICGDQTAAYVGLEVSGLVLDLAILLIPLIVIPPLMMPLKRRIAFLLVFSVGGIVTIITALRLVALNRINSSDFSYDQGYLGLLSILGALLGIITCCAPSVAAFIRILRKGSAFAQTQASGSTLATHSSRSENRLAQSMPGESIDTCYNDIEKIRRVNSSPL